MNEKYLNIIKKYKKLSNRYLKSAFNRDYKQPPYKNWSLLKKIFERYDVFDTKR